MRTNGDSLMEDQVLSALRGEIDRIDRDIIRLLNQRGACAVEIGRLKRSNGFPVFDAAREKDLMQSLLAGNDGPVSDTAMKHIFSEVISACRALQTGMKVAYLGPEATFTHQAAMRYFGGSVNFVSQDSIPDVFRVVERGQTPFGVVPVENSSEGAVGQTLDHLAGSGVRICGETFCQISHCIMSLEHSLGAIERVYSHPQALAQCLGWLSQKLPSRPLIPVASTSAAAVKAGEERGSAAVGSSMLAGLHGLEVLATDIQDLALNQTRFLIIGSVENSPTGKDKTSVLFTTSHKPGALWRALTPLAEMGINLTKIESRPSKERPWEYIFFVDFEGHIGDDHVALTIRALEGCVEKLKVLGSYPAADLEQ